MPKAPLHSLGLETEIFFRSEGSEPGSSLRAELTVVATNMQAQTLRIAVGDVLTAADGKPLRTTEQIERWRKSLDDAAGLHRCECTVLTPGCHRWGKVALFFLGALLLLVVLLRFDSKLVHMTRTLNDEL